MSASSKKKLRNAQENQVLTEKQQAEQKEAKKLKIYTTVFVVVLALMVVFAIWTTVSTSYTNSGIRERKTIAMTAGDHEISNAELSYYFVDTVNEFYSQYGSYASMMGLDATRPLNEQVIDEETGMTWADNFLDSAKKNAKASYALADEAARQGFVLSDADKAQAENLVSSMTMYAMYNQFPSVEEFLKNVYGKGATEEGFRAYAELITLADAFQVNYADSLTYDDAALREAEKENYAEYSSFSYNSYYLPVSKFLEGGTKDESGTVIYSEEEKAAAEAAAKTAAEELAKGEYESAADLDKAIAALSINADAENIASQAYVDNSYSSINSIIRDWVIDSSRKAGDLTSIVNASLSTDADGKETSTTNGYYIVYFDQSNDNKFALANVRHILVAFEGGTLDENNQKVYSDEEKAAAKIKAEDLLSSWKNGDSTEESFAALAAENSKDPGSAENGGLYEDIYPGQMVPSFNDWCFDESRKPGDTGIVETNYGYHIMFYCSDSDMNFRDFQIINNLKTQDTSSWYNTLVDAVATTDLDARYIPMDMIVGRR